MIGTAALGAAGVAMLATALALGYRAMRQARVARSLVISSPRGIAEDGYVRIGGVDQWLQIRGEDRDNPVLLALIPGGGHCAVLTQPDAILAHFGPRSLLSRPPSSLARTYVLTFMIAKTFADHKT
jgi:hypothetical protein